MSFKLKASLRRVSRFREFCTSSKLGSLMLARRDDDSGSEPDMLVTSLVRPLSEKGDGDARETVETPGGENGD